MGQCAGVDLYGAAGLSGGAAGLGGGELPQSQGVSIGTATGKSQGDAGAEQGGAR